MKKIIVLLMFIGMTMLFSCEKQQCGYCETHFEPVVIAPRYFSVCSLEEFNYWNGKTEEYIQYGTKVKAITICKWGNFKEY